MAVSLGTVFILNSAALLIFPPLGHLLHLSQTQFGLWAALAIHEHKLRCGCCRALRWPSPDYRNHGETRSCTVDCALRFGYCNHHSQ